MGIKTISIRAIRGIRHEINLTLDGKSWLIHGDNGTGKSSIERAMRWAFIGTEVPSAEKALSSEASCRRHILEPEDSPRVVVVLENSGRIEVGPSGLKTDDAGNAYRVACCNGNPFLRRLDLLEFLNSKPVDRFRYLDSFLDLSVVDDALQSISDKEKQLGRLILNSEQAIQASLTHLASRLPSDERPSTLLLDDFRLCAARLGVRLNLLISESATWEQLNTARIKAETLSHGDSLEKTQRNLINARESLERIGQTFSGLHNDNLDVLNAKRLGLEQAAVLAKMAPLLEHARRHIANDDNEQCPLCGQFVNRQELLESIDRRLIELTEYRQVVQEIALSARRWREVWKQFVQTSQDICRTCSIGNLLELPQSPAAPAGVELLFDPQLGEDAFRSSLLVIGPPTLLEWCNNIVTIAFQSINEQIERLPLAAALGDLRTFSVVVNALEKNRESIERHQANSDQAKKRLVFLQNIYESMRKARQDVAQEVFDEIGAHVANFYSIIHPESEECEVTRAPSIEVQRHSGGTAFVRGEFASQSVKDPKWVYSDGHLDTVGICIFLALRRYRAKSPCDPKIMVLDDVVLSIDLGHARRLITLLRDEFKDHQLIIFTHNGLFARWCLGLIPGIKKIDVLGWTLETGPRISDYPSGIERLKAHCEKSPPKEIALNLNWLMDELLAECRIAYSLSVPAKLGEEYTLSEIWEPFSKVVRDIAKQFGDELLNVVTHLDALRDLPRIRNMLAAHENEFAQEFPRETIVEIANNAIALIESIYCLECHTFAAPVPNRNQPQLLTCRCERLRYIKPSKAQKLSEGRVNQASSDSTTVKPR